MVSLRRDSRRTRITPRPLLPRLLLVLLGVTVVGVSSGYGVSRIVKARRSWLAQAESATSRILERMEDLKARHPDYPPPASVGELEAFLSLPTRRRARDMGRGDELLATLRRDYRVLAGESATEQYKSFSPNGFRLFFDGLRQAETGPSVEGARITGLPAADERITSIARGRGYKLRPVADEGVLVTVGDNRTHAQALAAFRSLQAAAAQEGIELELVSGYRSLSHQRAIFTALLAEAAQELRHRAVTADEIARGEADDVVDLVLQTSAIPGYSKHHTGYAMDWADLTSGMEFTDFDRTPAHRWLARDNYYNAKRLGFIPSYPPGASQQGPEPETWEYVWVGIDLLKESW